MRRMPAPAQEQNLQAQNQNISPKVAGPAPLGQGEKRGKVEGRSFSRSPQTSAGDAVLAYAGRAVTETGCRLRFASDRRPGLHFCLAPGRAGLIEFSRDGGRSWIAPAERRPRWTC